MTCLVCAGMGCDSCGKLGEQSLDMRDVHLNEVEQDLKACKGLLGDKIRENAELRRELDAVRSELLRAQMWVPR